MITWRKYRWHVLPQPVLAYFVEITASPTMADHSLASDRPKYHELVAYTQLVSCSIRNDAGPMELQEAEVCLDGKGRPSNLRRSQGILHVDSYTVSVEAVGAFARIKLDTRMS
jgi:hypothetical protein